MKLAHTTMGLCVAGPGLPAMAERAREYAPSAAVAAMLPPASHKPDNSIACDGVAGKTPVHAAAPPRLQDAQRSAQPSFTPAPQATARRPTGFDITGARRRHTGATSIGLPACLRLGASMQSNDSFRSGWAHAGLSAVLVLALSACGGGGGGGGSNPQGGTSTGVGTGTDPGTGTGSGTPPGGTTSSGSAPAYMQGMLVGSPFGGVTDYDAAELSLASSVFAKLPRSDFSRANNAQPDSWTINNAIGSHADFVRVDRVGNVDFFDRVTLARTGGFSLSDEPNSNSPRFWSDVKPSPDGRYILAYWKQDYHDENPMLAVFDRNGNVVQQGAPVDYDVTFYWNAFDWLPDGRYVFLAGPTLVTATVGNLQPQLHDLVLPAGVGTGGAELSVSPDGTQIAAKLAINLPDLSGNPQGRGVLFVTDAAMTTFRQLTTLTQRAQGDGAIAHSNAMWSPDGKYIAFTIAYPQAGLALAPAGCPPELVVPASAQSVAIDGIEDPPSLQFLVTAPNGTTTAVHSCYAKMSWVPAP